MTCGDIGTNPEDVEKYLESVLYIGQRWGCCVLLDEADVFLEERTQTDLQRNALVSVFLRVLEYYEGILILTSNRVGTFDEAFKSRVQLALHYPSLDLDGRWAIWSNFINGLRDTNPDAKVDELRRKIDILAKNTLNGREIRNTVCICISISASTSCGAYWIRRLKRQCSWRIIGRNLLSSAISSGLLRWRMSLRSIWKKRMGILTMSGHGRRRQELDGQVIGLLERGKG